MFVINGQVANAGSILNFFNNIDINVPNINANIITENNEILTVIAKLIESLKNS